MAYQPFRKMDAGNGVEIPVNTHRATDDYFVDRSRLRTREVTEDVPGKPGKEGKYVTHTETASIMDNARQAAGAMRMRSSNMNRDEDGSKSPDMNECCTPYYRSRNPLERQRGDE